ncbi:hypothetical protein ACFPYI_21820 [Halomarina salina]|uniref:Restriction endonuclease n=1 Tax=Halomarina salina TaxID=1872699 RepID=A0ABD5RU13_9EURY|nr:hypothetical protein [Halomarina salina]
MTLDDHSPTAYTVVRQLERFVDEIGRRNATAHFSSLFDGRYLKGRELLQRPERFVEDHLVFPVLESLGHSVRPRPVQYAPRWPKRSGVPDFALTTVPIPEAQAKDIRLFGEVKTPNKITYAREDAREYMSRDMDLNALMVLTDGFEWEFVLSGSYAEYPTLDLEPVFHELRKRLIENESYDPHSVRKLVSSQPVDLFTATGIRDIVEREYAVALH